MREMYAGRYEARVRLTLRDDGAAIAPGAAAGAKVAITQPARYCTRCGGRLARDNTDQRCSACRHLGRDALIRPPQVPRAFWGTDQMRDALATWHIGRVIFAYRTHPQHGRPCRKK